MNINLTQSAYESFVAAENQNNKNKIKSLQMQLHMAIRRLDDCSELDFIQRVDILRKQSKCLSHLIDCLSVISLKIDSRCEEDLQRFDAALTEARESLKLHPR